MDMQVIILTGWLAKGGGVRFQSRGRGGRRGIMIKKKVGALKYDRNKMGCRDFSIEVITSAVVRKVK